MARMLRNIRHVYVVAFLSIAALAAVSAFTPGNAAAQTQPRPPVKGKYKLKIDSSPQQAAVYWDSSATQQPKLYGIAGYTPITIKVPKGAVKIVLELSGFKPFEQVLDVRKNTTITPTLERAPRMARLDLQCNTDSAGAEALIDGQPRGTIPNSFELSAGRHQIEIRKAGHKSFSDWVDLQEGERRTRDVTLEKAEAPTGTLLVNSDAGGDVWVDGQRKDAAPAIIGGLAAGDHLLPVAVVDDDPPRDEVAPVPRLAAAAGQLREHRGRVHAGGRRLEADRQPTPVDEPAAVLGRDLLERELVARRTRHWLPPLRTGRRLRRRHGTQYDPAVQNNARSDERLATPTTA